MSRKELLPQFELKAQAKPFNLYFLGLVIRPLVSTNLRKEVLYVSQL